MTRRTNLCRRQELSGVAAGSKIASTLSVHIAVHVASVFIVVKNGHGITTIQKIFSCMCFRNSGISATMSIQMIANLKMTQRMLRYFWQCLLPP
jgi:hypothetical protein